MALYSKNNGAYVQKRVPIHGVCISYTEKIKTHTHERKKKRAPKLVNLP